MTSETTTNSQIKKWIEPRSQWMAATLVLLMIGILCFQIFYSPTNCVMCELLHDYETESAERRRIVLALDAAGLNQYEIRNDSILVPKLEHSKYLKVVSDANLLPQLFGSSTDSVPKFNPFMPRSQQQLLEMDRKRKYVNEMVVRLPFVADAWFEMDRQTSANPFGHDRHSAVIVIQPAKNHALTIEQVATVRELITGAVASLNHGDVVVTDLSVGIAYDEKRTPQQSKNIALVQWRLNRQRFYENEISRALFEFDGIEIEVFVESPQSADPPLPKRNQTAHVLDFKPLPKPNANRIPGVAMSAGANGKASLVETDAEVKVVHANHSEPVALQANAASMPVHSSDRISSNPSPPSKPIESSENERVSVVIRVPQNLIKSIHQRMVPAEAATTDAESVFRKLKSRIIAKVSPLLPTGSFLNTIPIAVVMDGNSGYPELSATSSGWPDSIRQIWPLIAVVLVGLLAAIFVRLKDEKFSHNRTASMSPQGGNEGQAIGQQLSQLIDKDPETAAKVIKNWIRQAG